MLILSCHITVWFSVINTYINLCKGLYRFKLKGNIQLWSYFTGKETTLTPEGTSILRPTGPKGECSLLKTKIMLQISRGSQLTCFRSTRAVCYPPVSVTRSSHCFTTGRWISHYQRGLGCFVVSFSLKGILGKPEFCCTIKVYLPIQVVLTPLEVAGT